MAQGEKKTCFCGIQALKPASITHQITHGDVVHEETSVLLLDKFLPFSFIYAVFSLKNTKYLKIDHTCGKYEGRVKDVPTMEGGTYKIWGAEVIMRTKTIWENKYDLHVGLL